jgi:hypothetical protein
MSVLRRIATAAMLACGWASFSGGCGTDAVGIDHCRDIEQARCVAAAACGDITDVPACQRFYRDHCLHGMALDESPGKIKTEACVGAIEAAGNCVKAGASTPAECTELSAETGFLTLCEAIREPQKLSKCSFLAPSAESPPPPVDSGTTADAAADSAPTD